MKEVLERKRVVERARYVVEAARRNHERMFGTPEEQARDKAEAEKMYADAAAQRRAELEAAAAAARGNEAAKKPSATESAAGADAVTEPMKKSGA